MAGEGACFMHCPPGYAPRPRDTGWFAAFGALTGAQRGVPYGDDGSRFLGATFDPSGLYRLAAVLDWIDAIGLTVEAIHAHVLGAAGAVPERNRRRCSAATGAPRHPGTRRAATSSPSRPTPREAIYRRLAAANIVTDVRAQPHPFRLRLLPRGGRDRARSRGDRAGARLTN